MKILRILPSMDFGGIERGVYDFSLKARELGHEIVIAAGEGRFLPPLLEKGVRWHNLPMDRKTPGIFLISQKKLRRIIETERPDIIHSQSRFPCWIVLHTLRSFPDIPWVTSIHSLNTKRFYSKVEGRGDRVITVSNALKKHAVEYFKITENKISIVYNGISEDFFGILKRRKKIPCIGIISRFNFGKGHFPFLVAVKEVIDSGIDVKALIVGSGSKKYKAKLKRWIEENNMEKTVEIIRMDAREALGKIDILVVPSIEPEGFGRTVVEGQMSKTPVIGTNIGAIPELIEEDKTGFLVEPGNSVQLAQKIRYILQNPRAVSSITELACKNALSNFTVTAMVQKTLNLYDELRESK